MIRPQSALLLSGVLVACGGDPDPRPPLTSADASGMITDPGRLDASLPDVQIPFDVRLPDGAAIPDGCFDDLFLLPDRPAPDVQAPADGPRSAYTCPTPRRIRRLAQPSTVTNLGPLGTMTSYQAPASVAYDASKALYVARDPRRRATCVGTPWGAEALATLWAALTASARAVRRSGGARGPGAATPCAARDRPRDGLTTRRRRRWCAPRGEGRLAP